MIRVKGMNAANLTETLSCMNNDDRKNISEYLKNQGIWIEEIKIEAIGDSEEYYPDVWYHTDTNEVIDLTKSEKAKRMSIEVEPTKTGRIEIRQTESETTQITQLTTEQPKIQEEQTQSEPEQAAETAKQQEIQAKRTRSEWEQATETAKQPEIQAKQTRSESEQVTETAEFEDINDEDEIIDLGDEREQVLEAMKESLNRLAANTKTEEHMKQSEDYLEEVHEVREIEPVSIFNKYKELNKTLYMECTETEVTLTVSERSGFHNLGEVYSNIPTVDEAVSLWKQLSSEHRNSIHAIGIHIHTLGAKAIEDVELDILSENKIHLTVLEDNPAIKSNPQVMEVVMELIAKLPEIEIDGNMSEIMEAAIWRMRMPNLTPTE